MNRFAAVVMILVVSAAARGDEIFQDFRGKDLDETRFRFQGVDASERIQSDAKGLRISLPANPKASTVGITTRSPLIGDFELTVGYELLKADPPPKGGGLGLEIYFNTSNEAQDALVFYRIVKPKGAEVYMCDKRTTIAGDRKNTRRTFPAEAKSGKLRLARQGNDVVFSAVDGAATEFKDLVRYNWIDDKGNISVRAWGSENAVELLLTDIRIRDQLDAAPIAPAVKTEPKQAVTPAPAPASNNWGWLIAAISVVFVGTGLLVGGLLMARLMRSAKSSPAYISFHCTHCGKHLKTDAAAGKTVKCVACSQSVLIPGGAS